MWIFCQAEDSHETLAVVRLKSAKINVFRMSSAAGVIGALTLSAQQTKADTCAKSVDPAEMACNKLSHQDLHCLPFCFWF